MITTPTTRLRELDFLRGVAIILVLFRHKYLFQSLMNMGWIGVDLFFTLSGFLVSGLLFKEYKKYGTINAKRFLIRRGFKIYPIYYLSFPVYIAPIVLAEEFWLTGFLADVFFLQNYLVGWGYSNAATWSLAVEEHFYIGISFFFWLVIYIKTKKPKFYVNKLSRFRKPENLLVATLITCFILRVASNLLFPEQPIRNTTMTHLRIDSLLVGVYISYLLQFKRQVIKGFFEKNKVKLLFVSFLFLVWTPFLDPISSLFVKTIGFAMLYVSFGFLLLFFILDAQINPTLDRLFGRHTVNIVSKIGYCSYSIYIIHIIINFNSYKIFGKLNIPYNHYADFLIAASAAVVAGMLMTYYIEEYFLGIRNKYFPTKG
jgi:peptidoglycan/LPS O-acetylase OafA/YrhL